MRASFDTAQVNVFDAQLKGLQDRLARSGASVTGLAQQCVERIKADAPVDTGELRDSIHLAVVSDGVEVHADAPYAWFVEFGTLDTPAQPYFYSNIEILRSQLLAMLRNGGGQ